MDWYLSEIDDVVSGQVFKSAWSGNNYMWVLGGVLELTDVILEGHSAEIGSESQLRLLEIASWDYKKITQSLEILVNLMSQLSGVTGYNALVRLVVLSLRSDLVQDWYDEHRSFTHTGLCLAENILALEGLGDGVYLHLTGVLEAALSDCSFELVFEEKLVPSGKVGTCVFLLIDSWLLVVWTVVIGQNVVHVVSQKIK